MYNKQEWKDEIPDLTRPIMDSSGKQQTDPQTGRPLYELVQEGTRITSNRLNHMEDGIEDAHVLVEQLASEIGGNFVATIDGQMGLDFTTEGLSVSWTAGVAYVGGKRFEVAAGSMDLNATQGQYLYLDKDGVVKITTSQSTAEEGLLLFYVATDASSVISTTDKRVNISITEIINRLDNIQVPVVDSVASTEREKAASANSVKTAYDKAVEAQQLVITHSNDESAHGIGNKTQLNTVAKDTIVNAINEVNEILSSYASGKDENGKYTTIEWKRADQTLFKKSVLSDLVGENYTVQTITWYAANGTDVAKTEVYDITYDEDGFPVSEVKR